ncbi:MAG: hypothetical protein QMC67_12590 [Candidatus Wallbacteria bacterium]
MKRLQSSYKRGYAAVILLMFVIISSILAQRVYVNAETYVKNAKETTLRRQLLEYNIAIKRFYAENKRYPETAKELSNFKCCLRQVYQDPMTNEKNFQLIKNENGCYAVSNSKSESFLKIPYNLLTVDITGKFVNISR